MGTGLLVQNKNVMTGKITFLGVDQFDITIRNGCTIFFVATTQGVTCSGEYAVTGNSGCPSGGDIIPSSTPSGGAISFSSASSIKSTILVTFMAAASVAANVY
jgi:hypothetical protein